MGAGEIIIGLIIIIFFIAAGLMGLAKPWEEPEDEVLDDLAHAPEDPTAP